MGASPKPSINGTMLADMLRVMDHLCPFHPSTGMTHFILLKRQQSRFKLSFFDYVLNYKHKCSVSVGVSYRTHIWQVGDEE